MKWSAGLVACLPAKPSMQMYMPATYGSYEMGVLGFLTLVWLHIYLNKRVGGRWRGAEKLLQLYTWIMIFQALRSDNVNITRVLKKKSNSHSLCVSSS